MTYTIPALPTEVGQRVPFVGYGGRVLQWMSGSDGTVTRFTKAGNPVVTFTHGGYSPGVHTVTDVHGCARLIADDGALIRETVTA